jgi:MoxR-like ATPase
MPVPASEVESFGKRDEVRTPGGLLLPSATWTLACYLVGCGEHIMIVGPTGVGKTTLALDVARALGRPYEVFHLGAAFDAELVLSGTIILRGGETRFVRSRFLDAITRPGCVVIVDEINRAPGSVANALLSVLDGQARIAVDLDDGGRRIVDCAPGVVVVATANIGAGYFQTETLDRALLDRFMYVHLDVPENEHELLVEVGLSPAQAAGMVRIARELRKACERGDLPMPISPRNLIAAARMVRDGFTVTRAFEVTAGPLDRAGRTALHTIVRAVK